MSVYKLYTADKCYIGSTVTPMNERINSHKCQIDRIDACTSKLIVSCPDWDWEVLEDGIPFDKVRIRERYWYDITENKVNLVKPYISEQEHKEYHKSYNIRNKKNKKNYNKKYYNDNREAIIEKSRIYREKNAEKIKASTEKNKEKNRERHRENARRSYEKNKEKNREIINARARKNYAKRREKYKLAKDCRDDKQDGVE